MKVIVGLMALFMLSSLGVGVMLSHGPEIRSVSWSGGTSNPQDSWSQDLRLTDAPLGSDYPAVVQDREDNYHIVWTDFRNGEPEIFYKKIDSSGKELIPDKRLSMSLTQSMYPAIAIGPDGLLHIAWLDERGGVWNVCYERLDGNGGVLVSDLQITNFQPGQTERFKAPDLPGIKRLGALASTVSLEGRRPSIDVDASGNAHLAWCDVRDGTGNIRYTVVGAGGTILTDQVKISPTTADSHNAIIRVWRNDVVLLWADRSGESSMIFYSRLDGSGNYLASPMTVLTEHSQNLAFDAALDADGLARIAWSAESNVNFNIYYAKLDIGGGLSGSPVQVTDTKLDSTHPSIKVDSTGAVCLGWGTDPDRLGRFPISGIFYARLTSDGNPIEEPHRIASTEFRSTGPAVALSGNDVSAVFWSDTREGPPNSELYMKSQVIVVVNGQDSQTVLKVRPGNNYVPAAAAVGGLGMLAVIALTEVGRFKLTVMAIPLYSRLKKESLLNHSVREQIFGYVTDHPGANFSQIMRELNLKNGVLAYHLTTLEREDLIKSLRDGTFRRYYPRSCRSVPFEIQRSILERIERTPGITENMLAEDMGLGRQVLDYHLMSLIESGHVRFERRGKRNLAYVTQVAG
jgi:DNA-binding transcriptional ArsR family regulator